MVNIAKTYQNEITLLQKFGEFQSLTGSSSLDRFGLWLLGSDVKTKLPGAKEDDQLNGYIGMLIAFMGKYANFYAKRLFAESKVYSMDDYGLLLTLERNGGLSKTELMRNAILEKSYGTEVIKRLLKQKLIAEFDHSSDKRQKLVELTAEGREEILNYRQHLQTLAGHVVGELTTEDKLSLIKMLQHLHQYHYPYFTRSDETEIKQLFKSK